MDVKKAEEKREKLVRYLKGLDSLLVAFSGGVDSTFLLAMAHRSLGDKVVAATALSATYSTREREDANDFTKQHNIRHIAFESDEVSLPEFKTNSSDRCYHCKKSLSKELREIAEENGISNIAHAANTDDLGDYRPGLKAADEMGIIAPLLEAGLNKEEIRFFSREMGLPTWNKPSMACLASRIPYGEPVTEEKLAMVAQAESWLYQQGFRQCRVRHHGAVARIEVEKPDMDKFFDAGFREKAAEKFKRIGFFHVALDLEGYVTGSLNRVLKDSETREYYP